MFRVWIFRDIVVESMYVLAVSLWQYTHFEQDIYPLEFAWILEHVSIICESFRLFFLDKKVITFIKKKIKTIHLEPKKTQSN